MEEDLSTVMYCYRIPKSKLWEFVEQMREFYLHNSGKARYARILWASSEEPDGYKIFQEYIANRENHIELQLFDFGNDWIFRVLEQGYLFMNSLEQFSVESVFYDDRTEVPEECEVNKEFVDQIDELVSCQRYFLVNVVDERMLDSVSEE